MIAALNITRQPYIARTGEEALQVAAGYKTEAAVINYTIADMPAENCIKQLKKEVPVAGIVCLVPKLRAAQINLLKRLGCNSFLPEEGFTCDQLRKALVSAVSNSIYYTEDIANVMADYADKKLKKANTAPSFNLTNIEKKVLLLIYDGLTSNEIAKKRNKALRTIEGIRSNLFTKFEVDNVVGLIKKALRLGVIVDEEI